MQPGGEDGGIDGHDYHGQCSDVIIVVCQKRRVNGRLQARSEQEKAIACHIGEWPFGVSEAMIER